MGRRTGKITAYATLSNHHDEQDEIDARAWKEFMRQVRELAEREEFKELDITVEDGGSY